MVQYKAAKPQSALRTAIRGLTAKQARIALLHLDTLFKQQHISSAFMQEALAIADQYPRKLRLKK